MDVHTSETEQVGDYNRREVLRRGAIVVGAATLWTTPVVQTLGMRPAAAGTGDETETSGSLCPAGAESSAQPRDLVFRWDGSSSASTALIVIQRPGSDRLCVEVGTDGFFQVTGKAGSNWRVGVYDPSEVPSFSGRSNVWRDLPEGGELLDASEFHTSCSVPLNLGDRFGTITLVAGTPPGGEQGEQVLAGVTLSRVQLATPDCAVHGTTSEQELEAEQIESDMLDEIEEPLEAEELKPQDVEVEEGGVETAPVETEKVEVPRGADDQPDGTEVDVVS